jgi:hypothetical protein
VVDTSKRSKRQSIVNRKSWKDPQVRANRIEGIKRTFTEEHKQALARGRDKFFKDNARRAAAGLRPKGTLPYAPRTPIPCGCGCGEYVRSKGAKYVRGHCNFVPEFRAKHIAAIGASYARGDRKRPAKYAGIEKGWYNSKKAGRFFYESSWERVLVQILDSSPLVVEVIHEPFRIPFKFESEWFSYFPDFYIRMRDGQEFVIEPRAEFRAKEPRSLAQYAAAVPFCRARGIEFRVFMHQIDSVGEIIQ